MDDDENNDGGEAYSDVCPWWGRPILSIDRWSTGTFHCSRCGRATVVVDGERRHAVEFGPTP